MNRPVLRYFADPMCSWCWGFSPVIDSIRGMYRDRVSIALILGGLRPGTREPVTNRFRDEILHHWHQVQAISGQTFAYDNALPEGFIYDTEPASRAVITVAELDPEVTFSYFSAVQSAFYTDNLDVTRLEQLQELAKGQRIDPQRFRKLFLSPEMRSRTQAHFLKAQEFGVHGFPTLILESNDRYHLLASGYRSLEVLQSELDTLV